MKETIEFRILKEYAHLLLKPGEGKQLSIVVSITMSTSDPRFERVRELTREIRDKFNESFFFYSEIKRKYSKKELNDATLFLIKIKKTFEPAGEECGTQFNEEVACEICGANRKQIGLLKLKKGSIPKKDIARTIAGEVVVSKRFAEVFNQRRLNGARFEPILFGDRISEYYQLMPIHEIELTSNTIAGSNVFDLSPTFDDEVYCCPQGDTIGLNLISEAHVASNAYLSDNDILQSRQNIGVKRGLLCPERLLFCSPAVKQMIEEEKLTGFEFEIARID